MLPLAMRVAGDLSNSIRTQGRKIFKLGTFNVRGLTKDVKQKQLSTDMTKYGLDVACIQETKITLLINKDVNGNRLLCTESLSAHYGLGFMVAPRWKDHIHRFWRVNDRISVLQLQTNQSKQKKNDGEKYSSQMISDTKVRISKKQNNQKKNDREYSSQMINATKIRISKDQKKNDSEKYSSQLINATKVKISKKEPDDHMVNIINVYAPTSEKVEKNPEEAENLYAEVETLLSKFKKMKSSITIVAGDFNAKVGKRINEERCMGSYSTGERNQSGQLLTDFCERNELFLGNTAFQHPARHITTWSQQRVNKVSQTVKNVFNQIDYILVEGSKKHCMMDARTYAGTETYSDHRLLIAKIEADWTSLYRKINKKQTQTKRINIRRLITDENSRKEYAAKLDERTEDLETWTEINEAVQKTAEEVLGYEEKDKAGEVKDECKGLHPSLAD